MLNEKNGADIMYQHRGKYAYEVRLLAAAESAAVTASTIAVEWSAAPG